MEIPNPINIVRLDGIHLPSPSFSESLSYTYNEYPLTLDTSEITPRLSKHKAHVAITTTVPITRATLQAVPSLKLVCSMAIGTDHIDLAACRELGVTVTNVPAASNESVAEHAIGMYFGLRRKTVAFHELTEEGTLWREKGSLAKMVFGNAGFPMSARQEVMGIIGAGDLGNRIATIGRALGMTVQLLDRREADEQSVRPGRVSFTQGLKTSTIIILTLPKTPETTNLISSAELALMRPDSILINVARGGIVDELALVEALRAEKIAGAAADVFIKEPATKENSPLIAAALNPELKGKLVLSPHVAWCATSSIDKLRRTVQQNVEGWARGENVNIVV